METERTLLASSKGIHGHDRFLLANLSGLVAHSVHETKLNKKNQTQLVKDLCSSHNCKHFVYLEARKKVSYLWVGHHPHGPTSKFLVCNVQALEHLNVTGNCTKNSRPVLSFDQSFENNSILHIFRQSFRQIFGSGKDSSFVDHVISFSFDEENIYFRNFEIVHTESLREIGPRFELFPLKIQDGVMEGETLYKNKN